MNQTSNLQIRPNMLTYIIQSSICETCKRPARQFALIPKQTKFSAQTVFMMMIIIIELSIEFQITSVIAASS